MKNKTPRNVLWLTTDHMRFDNIGAHGNPLMVTPNMDRLGFLDVFSGTGAISFTEKTQPEYERYPTRHHGEASLNPSN